MRFSLPLAAVTSVAALTLAIPAHAAWSNAQSMYTEDGVEIGVDARVFALFAMLNGLGFDDDTERGPPPLHRPLHAPARDKARQNLGRPGGAMAALEKIIEKNPAERGVYVDAVLELGPAPDFDPKNATSPLAKAIAGPLRDWYNEEGGVAIERLVADDARPAQKRLLPLLNKAVKATTALVRLGDKQDQLLDDTGAVGRVVVVLNDLDAHSTLQRVQHGDVTFVVVGPSAGDADDQALTTAVVAAYAKTLVVREAAKVAPAGTLLETSKLTKAKLDDKSYAAELLACGFAQQVRGKPGCTGSSIAGDPGADAALAVLAPRIDAFAKDTTVLPAVVAQLLAAAPAADAPAPPAKEEPKKDAKKAPAKKGKGK